MSSLRLHTQSVSLAAIVRVRRCHCLGEADLVPWVLKGMLWAFAEPATVHGVDSWRERERGWWVASR
jgi:hypothetical protein